MTKKDYEVIAGYVNCLRCSYRIGSEALEILEIQTEGFCELLEQINPQFNRETFLKACGLVGLLNRD